ncbi:MAG: DNA polymerase III subunit beta, partial [Patescibacteria group bacterium]
ILGNILLKAEKGLLYLVSTNLEIAIETYIRGKIEESGSFTVPADLFSSHLNFLSDESINLEVKGGEIFLKYKKGETRIKGLPAEDFPIIPYLEKKDGIKIPGQDFKKSLSQVIFAASPSETRPEISGVFFKQKDKKITLVATDSYRLAEKTIELKESLESVKIRKAIIPIKTCQELIRIIEEGEIEIFLSQNQILFSQGPTTLISRVIQAEFPNYEEIIPQNFKTKVLTSREVLIKTIRGASPFSKTGINDISLEFLPQRQLVIISSLNPQAGEVKLNLEGEISGEKNSLSFNYRYLLEGLASIPTNEVILEVIDDSSPAVLKPFPEGNFLYLVMPIKT